MIHKADAALSFRDKVFPPLVHPRPAMTVPSFRVLSSEFLSRARAEAGVRAGAEVIEHRALPVLDEPSEDAREDVVRDLGGEADELQAEGKSGWFEEERVILDSKADEREEAEQRSIVGPCLAACKSASRKGRRCQQSMRPRWKSERGGRTVEEREGIDW